MDANIFISFASQDHKVAMTLCSALESRGFKCWISARDIQPGENFQSAIVRAIRQAKIMLLVFTSNSNNSDEMNKELALASQSKLIVVPLRIEDVTPNDAFAYEFATRQWIDFFADWEFAIQQLSQRISAATREAQGAPATVEPAEAGVERPEVAAAAPPAPEEPVPAAPPRPARPPAAPRSARSAAAPPPDSVEVVKRSRAPLYIALSAAAAVALAAGLIMPGVLRHKPAAPGPRIMAAVHPAAPTGLQQVSIQVAPDPALVPPPPAPPVAAAAAPGPETPAAEPHAARKKKSEHAARTADNYVPY